MYYPTIYFSLVGADMLFTALLEGYREFCCFLNNLKPIKANELIPIVPPTMLIDIYPIFDCYWHCSSISLYMVSFVHSHLFLNGFHSAFVLHEHRSERNEPVDKES